MPWRSGASILQQGEAPSPLDLIGLAFAFTQAPLLTPAEFIKSAADRGVEIRYQQLQVLFRRQLLVPMFAIHSRRVRPRFERDFGSDTWTDRYRLVNRARNGCVSDPATKPHPHWPTEAWQAPYLYSEYQLLALRMLGPLIAAMPRTLGSDGTVRWRLGQPAVGQVDASFRMRDLAIVLEVLSTRYRSAVLQRITNATDSMWAYFNDHDRRDEERLLTLSPDRFVAQADHLLFHAGQFDPMGSWHRVIRIGSPGRWHELRNEALLAMDYRIAAELLFLHYEDLVKHGAADPLEPPSGFYKPHGDRLAVDFRERGETVMDFELSQRPRAVLALEGPTEMTFARALLKHFKVEDESDLIHLVNLRGINRDIRLLAHTTAVPRIDPNGYVGATHPRDTRGSGPRLNRRVTPWTTDRRRYRLSSCAPTRSSVWGSPTRTGVNSGSQRRRHSMHRRSAQNIRAARTEHSNATREPHTEPASCIRTDPFGTAHRCRASSRNSSRNAISRAMSFEKR